MQLLVGERAFTARHQVITRLRGHRELGNPLALDPEDVHALLQEIDLLQIVGQAADHVANFPPGEDASAPTVNLQSSLRRWKE